MSFKWKEQNQNEYCESTMSENSSCYSRVCGAAGDLGDLDVPLPELGAQRGGGALGVRHVEVQAHLVSGAGPRLHVH